MKSTAQRLSEVYCRPKTDGEWRIVAGHSMVHPDNKRDFPFVIHWKWQSEAPYPIGHGNNMTMATNEDVDGKTEIPVSQFIDLLNDSIVPWRLEEDGFIETDLETCLGYEFALPNGVTIQVTQGLDVAVIEGDGFRRNHILFQGCKTYTKLLNLIEMIG